MGKKKTEEAVAEVAEVTPEVTKTDLEKVAAGFEKKLAKVAADLAKISETLAKTTARLEKAEKEIKKLGEELKRVSDETTKDKAEIAKLAKEVAGKIGYVENKDGLRFYDRIGGKTLAGPFLMEAKEVVVENVVETEAVPAEPASAPVPTSGRSATDHNGKMYVYVDMPDTNYEIKLDSKAKLDIAMKTDAFFIVTGKPNTAFRWEVSEEC